MKFNFNILERYRVRQGAYGSYSGETFGAFLIPFESYDLKVIATDGKGVKPEWEHVSVSLPNRTPNWKEMSFIKDLFWDEEEIVIQYHPSKSQYVNQHPNCLHLWKKVGFDMPLPPMILVGSTPTQTAEGK